MARLLAASVPSSCAGLVAYHASGYPSFLAAALAPPTAARTVVLRCVPDGDDRIRPADAVRAGRHVAVADWRLLDGQLFLNGIAVDEDARGAGLGSALLADGLALARRLGCTSLGLDVALDNTGARRLYRRTGFVERAYTRWDEVPVGAASADRVYLLDWPSFVAHHDRYGFGDLQVRLGTERIRVRIVGDNLRVPYGVDPGPLFAALADLLPVRRTYTLGDDPDGPDGPAAPATFARFARMVRTVD